jgi:hypothetical protein
LEGYHEIERLAKEDVYNYGDFCFVDYETPQSVINLRDEQIAELLYLGHLHKPLHSAFSKALRNRFAYIAHDDGWFCKLYCQNPLDFGVVLCKKILTGFTTANQLCPSDDTIISILHLAEGGLLIDLDEMFLQRNFVNLYSVGLYSDMDFVLNTFQELKHNASQVTCLHLSKSTLRFELTPQHSFQQ